MNPKQIKTNLLLLVLFGLSIQLMGQRIRKDHREMTPTEKTLYATAVKQNRAYFEADGLHHQCHFGQTNPTCTTALESVHQTELFLPWHRLFIYDAETALRVSVGSTNLAIPYWDWRAEPREELSTWEESSFLGQFDDPTGTIWRHLQRGWSFGGNLNTNISVIPLNVLTRVNNALNSNAFGGFQNGIENTVHAAGHAEVDGAMSGPNSPWDPLFYLHHGMVDKLWQEWEDKTIGDQSDFTERNSMPDYNVSPDATLDSRYLQNLPGFGQDVWYAYNKKLLLDGSGSFGFGDFTPINNKLYCYTAWNGSTVEGTIYAGDVKRDASDNVVADNKGGFQIPSGKTVDFRAGKAIYLMGGFKTVQGAAFSAKCVTTPCGFSSNTLVSQGTPELSALDIPKNTEAKAKIQIIPNPIGDALNIQYEVEDEAVVQIHVFNVLGQVVAQYQPGIQIPGKYSYSVSTQGWSKGIYNCRVSIGKESTSVKAVH